MYFFELQLRRIVNSRFGLQEELVSLDDDLVNDLGADSIDFALMIAELEKVCDRKFKDKELTRVKTLRDLLVLTEPES